MAANQHDQLRERSIFGSPDQRLFHENLKDELLCHSILSIIRLAQRNITGHYLY